MRNSNITKPQPLDIFPFCRFTFPMNFQPFGSSVANPAFQDHLNDRMPDLLAFDLAYGGGGKAKKAIVKPKVVPVALPPEPEPVSQKAEAM